MVNFENVFKSSASKMVISFDLGWKLRSWACHHTGCSNALRWENGRTPSALAPSRFAQPWHRTDSHCADGVRFRCARSGRALQVRCVESPWSIQSQTTSGELWSRLVSYEKGAGFILSNDLAQASGALNTAKKADFPLRRHHQFSHRMNNLNFFFLILKNQLWFIPTLFINLMLPVLM